MLGRLSMLLMRPFDPEKAHRLIIGALSQFPVAGAPRDDPRLSVTVAGLRFANPIGLAAGFDKDARAVHAMAHFGFAGAEVGTLTPLAQDGNPRPRLFRLHEDVAVINRMGFNNGGQAAAFGRLSAHYNRADRAPFGINIGANKDAADRVADYVDGVKACSPYADWLTINISSPNTPGLRALQDEGALDALLAATAAARGAGGSPIFLKVAPDLDPEQIDAIVRASIAHGINAIIVGNTTVSRPPLHSRYASETGGLSGAPLAGLALQRLRDFRRSTGGQLPLIAAGGIASADDIWARMRAGATMVQLYSALVYEGPWLAARMARDLLRRMDATGVTAIKDIIDADNMD
ncbi:MAG: quinone-dependent dihydroorotate dehydrogenase [Sphingopyxis sp.]